MCLRYQCYPKFFNWKNISKQKSNMYREELAVQMIGL